MCASKANAPSSSWWTIGARAVAIARAPDGGPDGGTGRASARTVQRADRIVFLDGDRIAEQGTHDELLHRAGRYAESWNVAVTA
ncbi:hypothetical protein ACQPZ2_25750 [Nocardia pseudovaccinii]|uniref:hypothetical protein n=1 Tax=Nocardia pseudovaccinii TaxID=189540 RepID=UPI003D8A4ACD